ncbi:MAG TPA: hypothetical protein VN700_01665 [Vicinamibacterales bacterium]|nr:hypothetical protein [Vicinamibacterales bacterium]
MAAQNDRTRQWARIGAATRLREIDGERQAILKEFPELKWAKNGATFGGPRRKLTADARKKLSAGMRKYWARRKAAAAAKSAGKN